MRRMDGFLKPRRTFKSALSLNGFCDCTEDNNECLFLCLQCPYHDCYHAKKHAEREQRLQARAGEMYRRYKHGRQTVREIAADYQVSEKAVRHALEMVHRPKEENDGEKGDE